MPDAQEREQFDVNSLFNVAGQSPWAGAVYTALQGPEIQKRSRDESYAESTGGSSHTHNFGGDLSMVGSSNMYGAPPQQRILNGRGGLSAGAGSEVSEEEDAARNEALYGAESPPVGSTQYKIQDIIKGMRNDLSAIHPKATMLDSSVGDALDSVIATDEVVSLQMSKGGLEVEDPREKVYLSSTLKAPYYEISNNNNFANLAEAKDGTSGGAPVPPQQQQER